MELRRNQLRSVPQPFYAIAAAVGALLLLAGLGATLTRLGQQLAYEQARQSAAAAVVSARQELDNDARLGVDPEDLAPLRQSLAAAAAEQRTAGSAPAQ